MSFQEDFREFLDTSQGFAVEAGVSPKGGGDAYKLVGILVSDYYPVSIGSAGFDVSFECAYEDAKTINYGDMLEIDKTKYAVTGIKPDGNGWIVLELERQN